MSVRGEPEIDWRRTIRLVGALRLSRRWQEIATIAFICLVLFGYTLLPLVSDDSQAFSGGGLMTVLLTFFLVAWTGAANAGWLYLPVSRRERRTAAWLIVSVVPLLFSLISCVLAVGVLMLGEQPVSFDAVFSLFGYHGLLAQGMALTAILFGKWPQSLAGMKSVSERTTNDWLMASLMMIFVLAAAYLGGRFGTSAGLGLLLTLAAIAASAMLLPLSQRFARLEPSEKAGSTSALSWHERGYFRGYRGHFAKEAIRSLSFALLLLAIALVMAQVLPVATGSAEAESDSGSSMVEALFSSWTGPAMLSFVVSVMNLQFLMRDRRSVLALPRGKELVMITPAFSVMLVYLPVVLPLVWHEVDGPLGLVRHVGAGALVALGLAYMLLAGLLRASSTVGVMVIGGLGALPIGFIGPIGAISQNVPGFFQDADFWFAVVGAALLAAGVSASLLQLRSTRNPYRPWPIAQTRWRGA